MSYRTLIVCGGSPACGPGYMPDTIVVAHDGADWTQLYVRADLTKAAPRAADDGPLKEEVTMKATRAEVYAALDRERAYQDAQQGNSKRHDGQPPMTPGELILCMEKCLADARTAWYAPNGGVACLDYVRKVGALSVQCLERHGAPARA